MVRRTLWKHLLSFVFTRFSRSTDWITVTVQQGSWKLTLSSGRNFTKNESGLFLVCNHALCMNSRGFYACFLLHTCSFSFTAPAYFSSSRRISFLLVVFSLSSGNSPLLSRTLLLVGFPPDPYVHRHSTLRTLAFCRCAKSCRHPLDSSLTRTAGEDRILCYIIFRTFTQTLSFPVFLAKSSFFSPPFLSFCPSPVCSHNATVAANSACQPPGTPHVIHGDEKS